jgi:hypothetical protein
LVGALLVCLVRVGRGAHQGRCPGLVAGGGSRCGHSFAAGVGGMMGCAVLGVGGVNQLGRPRRVGVMTCATRADPLPVRSCRTRLAVVTWL